MSKKQNFWFWFLLPAIIGGISGLISKNGIKMYNMEVVKPMLSPPPMLFPIVWTVLFLLVGYGAYRVFNSNYSDKQALQIALFVQVALNFLWSPIFFNTQAYMFASVILVALLISVIIMTFEFYKADKTAGLIQIPYLIWLCFALYLNISVTILN